MNRQAFNRAGVKPEGAGGNDFLEAILKERPDLRGQTAYFPGSSLTKKPENAGEPLVEGHFQGRNNHTVFIGNEVFKGPRFEDDEYYLDHECKILKMLEDKGLPIPKITCIGKEAIFFGMTRVPGVQLPDNFLDKFGEEEIQLLAKDIAGFIADLAQAVPRQDGRPFTYGDLQPTNVLIDPDTKRLASIVDFNVTDYSLSPPEMRWIGKKGAAFNQLIKEDERIREIFGSPSKAQSEPKSTP